VDFVDLLYLNLNMLWFSIEHFAKSFYNQRNRYRQYAKVSLKINKWQLKELREKAFFLKNPSHLDIGNGQKKKLLL
jgi:hypothetical protein